MDEAVIKLRVDEFVKWTSLMDEAKKEIEKLKAEFQKKAMELMKNKKVKQVEFWGTGNSRVAVTTTETLKLVSYNLLSKIIGETLIKDFVREEMQYRLSEPFKRILAAAFQGNYVEQSLNGVINQITADEKTKKALKKKLKGNWEKDVESLKIIAGLGKNEAEHYAYFIQEAVNYEKIVYLLEAAGHVRSDDGDNGFKSAMENIKHAVVVEESIKVSLEREGDQY